MTVTEEPPAAPASPASPAIPAFPFPHGPGVRPPERFAELPTESGLPRVRLSSGPQALLVGRHTDVRAVLGDDRFSREAFPGRPMFARTTSSLALAASDPPVHTHRRQAVAQEFTARQARLQTPRLREIAADAVAALRGMSQPADLVEGFAVPFALRAITELMGVPYEDGQRLRPAMAAMMSFGSRTPDEVAAAHEEVHDYFAALVGRHQAEIMRGEPGADLLTRLLAAPSPARERLSVEELVVFAGGLLMAGFDTTANQLAMAALLVISDEALAAHLRSDPAAIGPALEEILRWSSLIATGGAAHVALEDVELGDVVVKAGDVVVPLTDAANQDPVVFDDPLRFDPARQTNPHLAFGHGRHYCLGAALARAELRVGLAALLDGFDDLRIAVPADDVPWREGRFIRGPRELPVRWGRGASARPERS